jgi:hypothetical protein
VEKLICLAGGFATERVCVRGGLMLRKQITNRVKGAEKSKRVSKRATVMQARKPTVDLAALGSEVRRILVQRTDWCSAASEESQHRRSRKRWWEICRKP